MSETETGVVYTLNDPRTGEPRYVGATKNARSRLKTHLSNPHSEELKNWIGELQNKGLKPELYIVNFGSVDELEHMEYETISQIREEYDLLNSDQYQPYSPNVGGKPATADDVTDAEVDEATTTVNMDDRGRVVIPYAVRNALGIDGKVAILEVTISVAEDSDDA